MKRILLLTAIAVSALTACQKAETTITMNLTDLPEGMIFQIIKWDGDGGKTVFTDTINGGTYSYTYKCDTIFEATSYSVFTISGALNSSRHIYVEENHNSMVSGSGFFTETWMVESENPHQQFDNKMNNATKDVMIEIEKLSAGTDDGDKTQEEIRELWKKIEELYVKYEELQLAALDSMPVDKYWLERFAIMSATINYEGTNYPTYPKLTEVYNKLSEADKATPIGKRITMNLFGKAPDIGDKITDYDLYDADGNIHHLSEFQGKWMLLDFSTYYCGPCRMFAPAAKYFYEKGINKNIEIVTVTLDTKRQFEEMVANEKYVSPLWNDRDGRNGIFALYKIPGYPSFYVVKPDGTIADKWMGADMGKILKTIREAGYFNIPPEYNTANGVTTITNPTFSDINGGLLIDKVAIYPDSVVMDCTYPSAGNFSISSSTGLYVNGTKVSRITNSNIGLDSFTSNPITEVGHCHLTFEPLPKNAAEFDFIEGDGPTCFRVMGIKIKE